MSGPHCADREVFYCHFAITVCLRYTIVVCRIDFTKWLLLLTASHWICLHIRAVWWWWWRWVKWSKLNRNRPSASWRRLRLKQRRRKRRVTVKQQRKQHWTRSVYVCSLFVVCLATRRMPSLRFSLSILLLVYLASLPKLNLASILTLTLARSIFTRSLAEMIELGESLARTLCPSSSPPLSLSLSLTFRPSKCTLVK